MLISALNTTLIAAVIEQLFEELKYSFKETGKVSDDILAALNNVFDATLVPALDLVDNCSVTVLTCPAGRHVYQVIGSSGTPYTCLVSCQYCSCPAYRFSVLKKEDHVMCKHVLAVKLSNAMGVTKELQVTDAEIGRMISQME
ncbi:zinc finger SWIM domain-containing protein 7-like isoform X2 [Dreissena polymorpha]|uniref:zinc finger SWIM domain-containing protein 7-like isoform X2 n=1 Tax=Dreissena polymorpha TaxID=45954 RepID=UPI00226559F4|nr:zinc finger SWIM domain-containing protein 7-like isoform X2 [Dreissena polymorpha]